MTRGLYAGSFDPMTCGHEDMIVRAANLCDELVVGIIENPSKKPMFTADERKVMIEKVCSGIPNVKVDCFSGLLADYVNENGFSMVIRGLRSNTDFEYELSMAQINARLYRDNVETVFLMTDPHYSFISSSMAKEVFTLGGSIEGLVPDEILKTMKNKCR
ncbi:MAG: pantetheine-phosphate adenylyltransferase [Eubacteriaceae bacterium]|jgi:pantetheine-phosphate adenylyltransferase|nr:pantetheine-phosphate adenylyltransferase [Eubacteriaceae bacterium]